nr:MAG TPA: hypothetical protein [Crassvirales sp.]
MVISQSNLVNLQFDEFFQQILCDVFLLHQLLGKPP